MGAARGGQTVGPLLAGLTLAAVGTGTTFTVGAGLAVVLLGFTVLGLAGQRSSSIEASVASTSSTGTSPLRRDATSPSPSTNTKNG